MRLNITHRKDPVMKLFLLAALFATATPAFAIYHGSEECVYQKGSRKIELSARSNGEGLGFDGLRLSKNGKSETIEGYEFSMPEAELKNNLPFTLKSEKRTVKFEVLAYRKVRDDSTSEECSISDDVEAKVTMRVSGLSKQAEELVFTCKKEGFNPNMGCRNSDEDSN
jgi:hypothetical protein